MNNLPKAKSKKSKKQFDIAEIAKFAQVSVEELKIELSGKNGEEGEKSTNNDAVSLSKANVAEKEKKSINPSTHSQTEDDDDDDDLSNSGKNGVIPLNPFLNDEDETNKNDNSDEDLSSMRYTTVYHVPRKVQVIEESRPMETASYQEDAPRIGYGSTYSQSQYEAFMRRSGMLATANATTTTTSNYTVAINFIFLK